MKITKEEVKHVANLARLKFSEEEIEKLSNQMTSIVSFADKLNELEISEVEAAAHSFDLHNVFRKDEVTPSFDRDKILQNAPSKTAGCYSVPKVVE